MIMLMKRYGAMAFALLCGQNVLPQQFQHIQAYRLSDQAGSKFGWSMAVADERLVVGLPHALGQNGLAAVFPIDDIAWTTVPGETVDEGNAGAPVDQRFGAVVAAGGGMIAVGSCSTYGTDQYCNDQAQWVSIYRSVGGSWQYAQSVPAPDGVTGNFGKTIAITDDHLAVGGGQLTVDGVLQDVVFLFARNGDFWTPVPIATLSEGAMTGAGNGSFGHALAMRADQVVVGASGDDDLGMDCGAAYVFRKDQGGADAWGLVRKLLPSDGDAGDRFGFAVAMTDTRIVVGAPLRTNGTDAHGGAYVFQRDAGAADNWGEVKRMTPDDPHANMQYGASVAVNDERIAVGAPFDVFSENGTDGSVEIFVPQGDTWAFAQRVVPFWDGHVSQVSRSGTALAFARDKLLIGAPFAIVDNSTPTPTGAVLVYGDPQLGVEETEKAFGLDVFPNPFWDRARIILRTQETGPFSVEIIDAVGRIRSVARSIGTEILLTRDDLAAGIYAARWCDASSGEFLGTVQFVVE